LAIISRERCCRSLFMVTPDKIAALRVNAIEHLEAALAITDETSDGAAAI